MSEDFNLESFLPYLLDQAAEATGRRFQEVYRARYGMTRTQWRVLANLGRFGSMTAAEICRISHLEKTKVSRATMAMEAQGWLRREASSQDRRAGILTLTPTGQDLFRQLGALALDYDQRLRAKLGALRLAVVEDVLRDLIALGMEGSEAGDAA
jgi:DNA-binding MarR family transcriptional regulator